MTFEFGKRYIVDVTERGITPLTTIQALEILPTIPKGVTNGDVLKAIFGAKFIRNTLYGVVCELDGEIEFSDKWWFAPYREDDEDDE